MQEERQAQEKAIEVDSGEEQASVKSSSPSRTQSPGPSSAATDNASAPRTARDMKTSDSQPSTAVAADASSSQGEEEQSAAESHAEPGIASPAASAVEGLYHHGDLGPSALSKGEGVTSCPCPIATMSLTSCSKSPACVSAVNRLYQLSSLHMLRLVQP